MYTSIAPSKKIIEKGMEIRLAWHTSPIFPTKIAYTIKIRASHWRTFSTRDESVDDDLCPVEEVSELCLPDGQVARTLYAETILKPQHRLFAQGTVGNLKWCNYNSIRARHKRLSSVESI